VRKTILDKIIYRKLHIDIANPIKKTGGPLTDGDVVLATLKSGDGRQ